MWSPRPRLDDPAELALRQIAQGTGGRFVFLTYGAAGSATGPSTDIATTTTQERLGHGRAAGRGGSSWH